MAEQESSAEMQKVIKCVSSLLQRIAETNDVLQCLNTQKTSIFHGLSRPTISIECYLERIFKYANCSPSCLIVAYIYLDRFTRRQPLLPINSFNVHRLLVAGVLVSAKFLDDVFYNNAYYAKVGGISTAEMNLVELDFLFGVGFQLNVSTSTFHHYCSFIHREIILQIPPLYQNHLHFDEQGPTHQHQYLAV